MKARKTTPVPHKAIVEKELQGVGEFRFDFRKPGTFLKKGYLILQPTPEATTFRRLIQNTCLRR